MTLFDHILMAALLIALPIEGVYTIRRLVRGVQARDPRARPAAYIKTMVMEWGLLAALLIAWVVCGRPWDALGVRLGDFWPSSIGVLSLVMIGALLGMQRRGVYGLSAEQLARFRERQGDTLVLMPSTPRERGLFRMLSITAGVCEESLYRGFALWYLAHWLNPWVAMLAASAVFGLAHAYQGRKGIVRTGLVGAVFGTMYLCAGSLLWPIIAHAAVDWAGGMLADRLGNGGTAAADKAPRRIAASGYVG